MKKQIIEGLEVPARLEFGNEAHIQLRDRIKKRKLIREDGIDCPDCGCKVKYQKEDGEKLCWGCRICGLFFTTSRDYDGTETEVVNAEKETT